MDVNLTTEEILAAWQAMIEANQEAGTAPLLTLGESVTLLDGMPGLIAYHELATTRTDLTEPAVQAGGSSGIWFAMLSDESPAYGDAALRRCRRRLCAGDGNVACASGPCQPPSARAGCSRSAPCRFCLPPGADSHTGQDIVLVGAALCADESRADSARDQRCRRRY